ncbi:NAD(P)-dependent oxidoreductase [Lysinibacillus parviboronicapiens]|uniref:NAD(P)-dependent oxidoreductase n=1 Tax=Lysinibacillus parviboronicapiens TaxID=436516 RepID=UPI000D3AB02E|nr:SDR family oxidoreductase [Lysinibacillus parviboronicapiens]
MKILVLGATGRVGSHIVSLALQDGHHVTALVRTPNKVEIKDTNLDITHGNVLNQQDIESVMSEIDIVISALNTDGTNTLTESMRMILETMKKANVKRIITVGTAGILQSRLNPHLLRYQSSESKQKTTFAAQEHHKVFDMLSQSDVDWTIVCPTYLPDGEYTGVYRTERNFLPDGGTKISVADTAEFTYQQSVCNEYLQSRVGIAY